MNLVNIRASPKRSDKHRCMYLFNENFPDVTKHENIEDEGYQKTNVRQDAYSFTVFPFLQGQLIICTNDKRIWTSRYQVRNSSNGTVKIRLNREVSRGLLCDLYDENIASDRTQGIPNRSTQVRYYLSIQMIINVFLELSA